MRMRFVHLDCLTFGESQDAINFLTGARAESQPSNLKIVIKLTETLQEDEESLQPLVLLGGKSKWYEAHQDGRGGAGSGTG